MSNDKRIDDIVEDVREIRRDVAEIKETLKVNTADVAHHIKRTDLLESEVESVVVLIKSGRLLVKVAVGVVAIATALPYIRAIFKF